jgi:hypothetical protein
MQRRERPIRTCARAVWTAALLCAAALTSAAQTLPPAAPVGAAVNSPALPAGELVRQVIEIELHDDPVAKYQFREWKKIGDTSKTKEMVGTSEGLVARLVAINDLPLTPDQEAAEQARLRNLLAHPELQRQKKKEQQQDEERMLRMFRELPRAFLYEYLPSDDPELIHLGFHPNPKFEPSSRESLIFKGMAGEMWIAAREKRLTRLEGTLFREITFGWGLLGRLDKGGHFAVRQAKIGPTHWEPVELDIQFTGRVLVFKSITLREHSRYSDYRPLTQSLTLAQAVDLLIRSGATPSAPAAAR